jgi:hypothetical protein
MAKRSKTSHRKDAKIFNQTAKKTKTINLAPKSMRGGTRL